MCKKWQLSMALAVAGTFLFLGQADAGSFTLKLLENDGAAIVNDDIILQVLDANGVGVKIKVGAVEMDTYTVKDGVFNFSITPPTAAVTLVFLRGNTPRTIPSQLGKNVRVQNYQLTIGPRS